MAAQLIDTLHLDRPRAIGCWLLKSDRPVLVDPGPETCVEALLRGLDDLGLELEDIVAVLITHIHLDHAGASGRLAQRCPTLKFYVHEVGAPHMVDPNRLVASATRLYGDDMDRLWGEVVPLPRDSVVPLAGGERLELGSTTVRVEYTPGHAGHHVCFLDESDGAAYVGDVAGVRIPPSTFVLAPTPPPDVDMEAWRRSLTMLEAWEPSVLRLTHFGESQSVARHLDGVRESLIEWGERVRSGISGPGDWPSDGFEQWARAALRRNMDEETAGTYEHVAPLNQIRLGLERYWRKRDTDWR